jgi:DNA invertase Pin-like site-specific DNA recombinase
MTMIGYARVSTEDQDLSAQRAELEAAGCARIFEDHGLSSRSASRPGWLACRDYLRRGDTLVVRALDRVAGTERMAIDVLTQLDADGIDIKSLTEPQIDTTSPMGRALFGIMAVFAQLRVDTIRENTRRGLAHARAEGRVGGRPTVMTQVKTETAAKMRAEGRSIRYIAAALGVSKTTVQRALSAA